MIHYPDKSVAKNLRNVLKIGSQRGGRLGVLFVWGVFFCLRWFGTLFQVLLLSTLPGTCRSGAVDPFILCYCSLLFRAAGLERQPQERRIRPKSLRCLTLFGFSLQSNAFRFSLQSQWMFGLKPEMQIKLILKK